MGGGADLAPARVPCSTVATAYCTQLGACSPNLLKLSYEDLATCTAVRTKECTDGRAAGDNGSVDTQACIAALTASYDAWFAWAASPPSPPPRRRRRIW